MANEWTRALGVLKEEREIDELLTFSRFSTTGGTFAGNILHDSIENYSILQ
jgi:hypothetical protein